MPAPRPHLLPERPSVPEAVLARVREDHDRFARVGLPPSLEEYLLEAYRLDVSASYGGIPLRNPWGKGSGQLSLNAGQVEEAADAGLGFVVLKTVIAEDGEGRRSMDAWAIREARMVVERIVGLESGAGGWTVTWKGRGWWQTFAEYLDLVRDATAVGRERRLLVVPSVKYHLPGVGESRWRVEEYAATTRALLDAAGEAGGPEPLPIEKDFSPTLAGSERSRVRETILGWLATVPGLVRDAAHPRAVRIGLKLFNALDDDDFQLAMLAAAYGPARPDYLVYGNRLFDPGRVFEGHRGVAYGGPDLSDRNLRLLSRLRREQASGAVPRLGLEISGTGDIGSGRMAVEYALRGCTSFQIHTRFQLPLDSFAMRRGPRLARALHQLYFDPEDGFIVWAWHAARCLGLGEPVRFLDLAARGGDAALRAEDLIPARDV
jgi:dihydroorotate dehydrogenase